jgi:DNA-binding NarL/FixJ family response regulator
MSTDNDVSSSVSVLIATPRPVLAEGLCALLAEIPWQPIRVIKKLSELQKFVKRESPDVVLIDCDWPQGAAVMKSLASLQALPHAGKTVLLYDTLLPHARMQALLYGCTALVSCTKSSEQILLDLKQIAALPLPQPWGELGRLYQYLVHPVAVIDGCAHLTARECQCLRLLGWGLSNEEIALALRISLDTVKEHLRHLFKKMLFTDRVQAAVWAVKHGMAEFDFAA